MAIQSAEARFYTGIRSWCVDKNATAAISSTSTINAVVQRIKRTYADLEAAVSIGLTNERYKTYGGGNNVITPGNPRVIDNTNNAKINTSLVCKFPTYIRIDLEKLQLPEATTCAIQFEEGWVLEGDFPGSTFAPSPAVPEFFIFRTPWFSGDLKFNTTSSLTYPGQRRRPGSAAASSSSSIYARAVLNPGKLAAIEVSDFAMIPRPNFTANFSSTLNSMFGPTNLISSPVRIKQLASDVYSISNLELPEFDVVIEFISSTSSEFNSNISSENSRIRYLQNSLLNVYANLASTSNRFRDNIVSSSMSTALSLPLIKRTRPMASTSISSMTSTSATAKKIGVLYSVSNPNNYGTPSQDQFGHAVAISDNYLVVGSRREDDASNEDTGVVYVFNKSTGALIHTLTNPNIAGTPANDYFGYSVAVKGNYILVGAVFEDQVASNNGATYLFNATTGALIRSRYGEEPGTSGQQFGVSVALTDSYEIISDRFKTTRVYNISTGSLISTINLDTSYDEQAVAADGNNIIIGSPYYSTNGIAHICSATTGAVLRTLTNPNPYSSTGDNFGYSVAIYGNYAVVGAPNEDNSGTVTESGKVYVFNVTTGSLLYTINNPSPASNDGFGSAVAINSTHIIVGASGDQLAVGSAHLYTLNGTRVASFTGVSSGLFGNAISTTEDTFAIAASFAPSASYSASGLVRVYSFDKP